MSGSAAPPRLPGAVRRPCPPATGPRAGRIVTRRKLSIDTEPSAALLAELERQCFPDPWEAGLLERLQANPATGQWVLHDPDGRAVAYLVAQRVPPEAEVLRIGVAPQRRRQGAARLLLRLFLRDCRRRGITRVFLEVRPGNAPALALYRSLGFEVVGRRKGYYQDPPEDSLVCARALPGAPAARAGASQG